MRETLTSLLNRLLVTHSPSGEEGEMEDLCRELLTPRCDEVWTDANDNVIGKISGEEPGDGVMVLAHKDEIGTIVRDIDSDGRIHLDPLGGCVPWKYGEGPWDVIGDEIITGILCVGSTHSSHLSPNIAQAKSGKPLDWEMVYVDCKLSREELARKGVMIGSRACVARSRKTPVYIGDCVGGYALDDKAGIAVLCLTADLIREAGAKPKQDVYLAISGTEEVGIGGGAYLARTIPAATQIAVEIAPLAPEYPIDMAPEPVIFYKDAVFVYHKGLADELCMVAEDVCGGHQRMLVRSFGSDTSSVAKYGYPARAGCIGFATENSHGFELGHLGAMEGCARVLAGWVMG